MDQSHTTKGWKPEYKPSQRTYGNGIYQGVLTKKITGNQIIQISGK